MKQILRSASKIVFLLFATTICATFTLQVVLGTAKLDEGTFKEAALVALTYYFTRDKGESASRKEKEVEEVLNTIE